MIEGAARANGTGRGKFRPLARVDTVNGMPPELARNRPHFDDLTPVYPRQRLRLEDGDASPTARIIDLVAPIGKGQRGLIMSPPKAGKTTILKAIATAISSSHPEVKLMVVLVGERPEEVTDLRRSVRGEVVYSTFDQAPDDHIRVAEPTTSPPRRTTAPSRAASRPPRCSRLAGSSAPRATWRKADR
jgi:transcription termination factor Rho